MAPPPCPYQLCHPLLIHHHPCPAFMPALEAQALACCVPCMLLSPRCVMPAFAFIPGGPCRRTAAFISASVRPLRFIMPFIMSRLPWCHTSLYICCFVTAHCLGQGTGAGALGEDSYKDAAPGQSWRQGAAAAHAPRSPARTQLAACLRVHQLRHQVGIGMRCPFGSCPMQPVLRPRGP